MEIDTETVLKIARLSRIKINESESADIQKDLNRIVEFVKKLGEIDIDGIDEFNFGKTHIEDCLLYTSPSPRDSDQSRMPSSA